MAFGPGRKTAEAAATKVADAARSARDQGEQAIARARKERKTALERREDILVAATRAFAQQGLAGTSTEEIAREAGISHPYVFRFFPTKRDLFLATMARAFDRVVTTFAQVSEGLSGEEALGAIAGAYRDLLADRDLLLAQLHTYAAASDPVVREAAREGYAKVIDVVTEASGAPPERILQFLAVGMLINVIAALDLAEYDDPGCRRLMESLGECMNAGLATPQFRAAREDTDQYDRSDPQPQPTGDSR